jgi:cytochrome P450
MNKVELSELDFFSAEVQECPFHVYQQLQEEAPVWQMPGTNVFVVTRYDDIREIIRDPAASRAVLVRYSTRAPPTRRSTLFMAKVMRWSRPC